MIITEGLSKKFGNFLAVDRVDLNIPSGEVLALLGPNGAGKTTTIRMLTSILRPTAGKAWIAGYDVVKNPGEVRARVGVLTEMHGLYNRMPAGDYLDFFGQLYDLDRDTRRIRILALLEQFGLIADTRRRIGEFSKGMRQKLALARALLHEPPVLLLDEPTSAMDPESARLVRDAILKLRSNDRALIICTHNLAEAEELANQIAIIRHGRIIAQGTNAELKSSMLGPTEYEIRLASRLNGHIVQLPPEASITKQGENWLRYLTSDPDRCNPQVLRAILDQGYPVIGLHEVPRSLEQVYLQVVNNNENHHNAPELAEQGRIDAG